MAYEEYDYYNEPSTGSLKESLREILNGLQDRSKLREAGTSFKEALQLTPNVTESLGRGGVAQAIGTSGDLRDLSNTINDYLPKGVRNFTRAAEFLANPYANAIQQTAPTTEQTLDFVPRVSAPYEGYKQHETLGEFVAPSLGYFGGKTAKAYGNYVGPTAYKAVEDYLTKTGGILNAIEPGETKKIQEVASAIDELGFHSPLENAILKIQQPKGTGDQFLKQLEKTPGVKTEELDVTGVKQYLLDRPTVTKQELLDYMGQNRVELENKILKETGVNDIEDYQIRGGDVYHDDDYIQSLTDDLHHDMTNDDVIRSQEREALLEADPERYADYETNPYSQARLEEDIDGVLYENAKQQANDMYYENPINRYYDDYDYEIYGNDENGYSFKSPSGEFLNIGGRNGTYDLGDAEAALREYHLNNGNIDFAGGNPKYEDYTLPGKYTNYREMLTTLPNFKGKDFNSSHFNEPNILAHTRLNDRIINGKKTLMVEEIQSDWHQAGRKKGYDTPEVRENIAKERQKLLDQRDYYSKLAEPYAAQGKDSPPDVIEGWTIASNKLQELQKVENNMSNAVPNAPYKKNWHELMMKQILNEAVNGNYDAVAFTTGKQQAARYNLSKQVDSISVPMINADGTRSVRVDPKDGVSIKLMVDQDGVVTGYGGTSNQFNGKTLDEVIGKDMANKVMKAEADSKFSGIDLEVGGEGMKGFYDKILPDFVNKYTKKYGMGVRKANTLPSLQGEQVHMVDLTDAAKKDIKEKGQPLFSGIGLAAPGLLMDNEEDN